MNSSDYIFFGGFIVIVIVLLILTNYRTVKDLFTPIKTCKTSDDCGKGEFCHESVCKMYWNGLNMPWNNCRDTAYCVQIPTNQPCGLPTNNWFPKCGTPCMSDGECPVGCPKCRKGICSSP